MDHFNEQLPDDLVPVAERLSAARPELTPLELDELKRTVIRRVTRRPRGTALKKGQRMKTRLALVMMIVLGLTMGGTGATVAINEVSGNAGVAQYGADGDDDFPLGVTEDDPAGGADAVAQQGGQVAAQGGGDALPFTGFAAIPLLLGGAALLAGGVALQRRTRE